MNLGAIVAVVKRLNKIRRLRPYVNISNFGQLTDRPGVEVSIGSRGGLIGVFEFYYDDLSKEVAEARATLYANDLSHITGLPIVDSRDEEATV